MISGMLRIFLLITFLFISLAANARMYQWTDPDNGTTQLSGKPPVWYRSGKGGPRVFVFENGKLIDDTGEKVSDTERESLRQQAMLQAEGDKDAAKKKLIEAQRLQAELAPATSEDQMLPDKTPAVPKEQAPVKKALPVTEQETIDRMKTLIQQWEAQRTQSARELINPATGK